MSRYQVTIERCLLISTPAEMIAVRWGIQMEEMCVIFQFMTHLKAKDYERPSRWNPENPHEPTLLGGFPWFPLAYLRFLFSQALT